MTLFRIFFKLTVHCKPEINQVQSRCKHWQCWDKCWWSKCWCIGACIAIRWCGDGNWAGRARPDIDQRRSKIGSRLKLLKLMSICHALSSTFSFLLACIGIPKCPSKRILVRRWTRITNWPELNSSKTWKKEVKHL